MELRKISVCGLCNKKIGKSGLPLFMRVNVKRYGLNMQAVQRQQGLGMLLGGHGMLAQVMGSDDDMADIISENTITVCETCAPKNHLLYEILERANNEN